MPSEAAKSWCPKCGRTIIVGNLPYPGDPRVGERLLCPACGYDWVVMQTDLDARDARDRVPFDPVEDRARAYHEIVATAPGPIGGSHRGDDEEFQAKVQRIAMDVLRDAVRSGRTVIGDMTGERDESTVLEEIAGDIAAVVARETM